MNHATPLTIPGQLTVRRAISLGARAANREQEVTFADPDDPEGYGTRLDAGELLEAAIAELDQDETVEDLYAIANTVRIAMRRGRTRRFTALPSRLKTCENRIAMAKLYRLILRDRPDDLAARNIVRRLIAEWRESLAEAQVLTPIDREQAAQAEARA